MFIFHIDNYNYRLKLTFDQDKLFTEEENFPVLIKLNSDNFDFTKAKFSGVDIVFTLNDNTTLLKYERAKYDYENKQAEFWIKLPLVSIDKRFSFYMYFGNFYHIQDISSKDVWDNNYNLVYHGQRKVVADPIHINSDNFYFFNSARESLIKGELSLQDDMKMVLLSDYTPDLIEHKVFDDISEYEIEENKYYLSGGIELENISFNRDEDIITWSADSIELKYLEENVNCAVVYKDDAVNKDLFFLIVFLCVNNQIQTINLDVTALITINWDLQIEINPAYIQIPSIIYPIENQENVPLDAEIQSSEFLAIKQEDNHVASEWQIYHEGALIHTSNEDPNNLLTYTSPYADVPLGEICQVRHRHKGENLLWSGWSDFVSFRYANPTPSIVSIIQPENNQVLNQLGFKFIGSVFTSDISAEQHIETEFEIYLNGDLIKSVNLTEGDLESFVYKELTEETEGYSVRVRYKGGFLGWSEWSGLVNFDVGLSGHLFLSDVFYVRKYKNRYTEFEEIDSLPNSSIYDVCYDNKYFWLKIGDYCYRYNPINGKLDKVEGIIYPVRYIGLGPPGYIFVILFSDYYAFNVVNSETLEIVAKYHIVDYEWWESSYGSVYDHVLVNNEIIYAAQDDGVSKVYLSDPDNTAGRFEFPSGTSGDRIIYKDGFIYVSYSYFISKINAVTMQLVGSPAVVGSSRIGGLVIAEDGFLYAHSEDNKLYKVNITTMAVVANLSINFYVDYYMQECDGYIYCVSSESELIRVRLSDFSILEGFSSIMGSEISSYYVDNDKKLYCTSIADDSSLYEVDTETMNHKELIFSCLSNQVQAAFWLKNNLYVFVPHSYLIDGSRYFVIYKFDNNLNFQSKQFLPTSSTVNIGSAIKHGNYFYIGSGSLRIHKIQFSDLTSTRIFESSSTTTLQRCNSLIIDKYNKLYSGGRTYHTGYSSTYDIMKFNAVTLEFESFLSGHTSHVNDLACDDDYLYSVSSDTTLRKWNLLTEELEYSWGGIGIGLNAITVDDNYIYIGTVLDDSTVYIYKLNKITFEIIKDKMFTSQVYAGQHGIIGRLNINKDGFLEVFSGQIVFFLDLDTLEIVANLMSGQSVRFLDYEEI